MVKIARRAGLSLASVGLLLACLELATVAGFDFRLLFGTPCAFIHSPHNRSDDELLWIRRPYSSWSGSATSDVATILGVPVGFRTVFHARCEWDANGFRNDPNLKEAEVVFIGDSFVEQRSIDAHELLTTHLSQLTGKPVANLGQSGYGPQQERAVLRRFAFRYKPSIIVWCFFEGNDLSDALNYEDMQPRWRSLSESERSLWKRSVCRNAWGAVVRLFSKAPTPSTQLKEWSRRGWLPNGSPMWFLYAGHQLNDEELRALDLVRECLERAKQLCDEHGAKFLVVFIPTKFRVYGPKCRWTTTSECRNWPMSDLPCRMRDIVAGVGADFLNLSDRFAENATEELLYFPDDTHWTPAGHELAARLVREHIMSRWRLRER